MHLIAQVPGSVLWLIEANAAAANNLRGEAVRRGVAADRVVFAPRTDREAHMARHQLADLFIDTLHYGAHTTASDALGRPAGADRRRRDLPVARRREPVSRGRPERARHARRRRLRSDGAGTATTDRERLRSLRRQLDRSCHARPCPTLPASRATSTGSTRRCTSGVVPALRQGISSCRKRRGKPGEARREPLAAMGFSRLHFGGVGRETMAMHEPEP